MIKEEMFRFKNSGRQYVKTATGKYLPNQILVNPPSNFSWHRHLK